MLLRRRAAAAAALYGALSALPMTAAPAMAQAPTPGDKASVEVRIKPETAMPGETVTMSGFSDMDSRTVTIRIVVTDPGKPEPVNLSVAPDKDGNFALAFDRTQNAGRYTVVASSPSGRSTATASFTVASAGAVVGEVSGELQADLALAEQLITQVDDLAATLPASPPKQEFQQRLATVRARVAEFKQKQPAIAETFDAMKNMLERAPSAGRPVPLASSRIYQ